MNEVSPQILELVHADIDGVITDADRQLLAGHLEQDAELREFHVDLQRLNEGFDAMTQLDPPSELLSKVLAELPAELPAEEPRNPLIEMIAGWFAPPAVRYAFSFVCGLIVAGGVMQMRLLDDAVSQVANLPGTMLPAEHMTTLSTINLSHEAVNGTVTVTRTDDLLRMVFDLQAKQNVDVILGFDGSEMSLNGYSQPSGAIASLRFSSNELAVEAIGKQSFVVQLKDSGAEGSIIEMRVKLGGDEIHHTSFDADTGLTK